jgi:hypothetical protein
MSQVNPPSQAGSSGKRSVRSVALVGLAIVAVLSLAFAGYTSLNPHIVTVTQQQMLTATQNLYSVQTQTVMTANTVTSVTTVTNMQQSGYGYGNGNYQYCNYYYGCYQSPGYYYNYPGYYGSYGYNPCQYTGSSSSVTCYGYFYQASNGCTLLVVPTTSNPYPSYATGNVYEYYTLHNLPSNTPQIGSWVTVNGQLYQGYNTASNGASCPNNYIIVNSIS